MKMRYFVLVALVSMCPAKVHLVIRFTKLLCNSTHPMTVYEKCHIERGHNITTITIRHKLLQPIYRVQANISLIQLSKSLNRVLYTFNNVDACAFILRRRNPVLRLLFAHFQKFSNINHSCPFKGHLIVDRFAISDIQVARLPILAGEYALLTAWKLNGVDAAYTNVFVSPEIRFKKIICNSTDPQIYFEKCYISKVNKSTTTLTMHQKLLQPIYSAYCNISVIQLSNSLNRVWYKFTNIDACGFFKKRRNPVLRIFFSNFQEFSNLNHTCPYKDYLIFNDLAIDDRKLAPIPAMPGDYVLQTDWRLNAKNTAQVAVFIRYTRNGLK